VDRSISPASDFDWANRAVIHCADVLNCCFGEGGIRRKEWEGLKDDSEQWTGARPSSFTPIFRREPNRVKGEVFPEIWHSHACHSMSLNLYSLPSILSPRHPYTNS
jgi:hypothetical protein